MVFFRCICEKWYRSFLTIQIQCAQKHLEGERTKPRATFARSVSKLFLEEEANISRQLRPKVYVQIGYHTKRKTLSAEIHVHPATILSNILSVFLPLFYLLLSAIILPTLQKKGTSNNRYQKALLIESHIGCKHVCTYAQGSCYMCSRHTMPPPR